MANPYGSIALTFHLEVRKGKDAWSISLSKEESTFNHSGTNVGPERASVR